MAFSIKFLKFSIFLLVKPQPFSFRFVIFPPNKLRKGLFDEIFVFLKKFSEWGLQNAWPKLSFGFGLLEVAFCTVIADLIPCLFRESILQNFFMNLGAWIWYFFSLLQNAVYFGKAKKFGQKFDSSLEPHVNMYIYFIIYITHHTVCTLLMKKDLSGTFF